MSDVSDISDAIVAAVEAAVAGSEAVVGNLAIDTVASDRFPIAEIVQTGNEPEPLPWRQENQVWLFECAMYQKGGTRQTMQTKLEAIRDGVRADPTLSGACDRASCAALVPESHVDSRLVTGVFVIRAEKVLI
jgi:hypothetical protein